MVISHENNMLGHFYLEGRFLVSYIRIMSNPSQQAICSSRNKSQMAPNEKVFFMKNWGWDQTHEVQIRFYRTSLVFEESMKERWSMYEHFPLCGSAWAAIWGRLFKKEFSNTKSVFRKFDVFFNFVEGDFGCFRRDFCKFVRILAWNRDGKWWEGVN